MKDDIDFWTERVVKSAERDDKSAFGEAMDELFRAFDRLFKSAFHEGSTESSRTFTTKGNTRSSSPIKKNYNLPKAK